MKILTQELRDAPLVHVFQIRLQRRSNIGGFYPFIVMKGAPVGTFTFKISSGSLGELFSKDFTSDDIKSAMSTVNNSLYVWFPIIPENPMFLERGEYTAEISSSGYFYSRASFIGWGQQHENLTNILSEPVGNDMQNPLALRLKVFKEGIL